jgi:hypothetical protein
MTSLSPVSGKLPPQPRFLANRCERHPDGGVQAARCGGNQTCTESSADVTALLVQSRYRGLSTTSANENSIVCADLTWFPNPAMAALWGTLILRMTQVIVPACQF